mmetsp:Transcript_15176/g.45760  ORF Transcript_15176/g.45760 Transcript_15176/m.45760 type:complete len:130 (+) Transcript_15176:2736-3125(+)
MAASWKVLSYWLPLGCVTAAQVMFEFEEYLTATAAAASSATNAMHLVETGRRPAGVPSPIVFSYGYAAPRLFSPLSAASQKFVSSGAARLQALEGGLVVERAAVNDSQYARDGWARSPCQAVLAGGSLP